MKNALINLVLLIASVCLVSCSTNTQNENTATGAVSGGVLGGLAGGALSHGGGLAIGAGIVAGALIGGLIGHNMDSTDNNKMNSTMENNSKNQKTSWNNRKTNTRYTLMPTSNVMAMNGNNTCRTYMSTTSAEGKMARTSGTACRQSNGNWQKITT